MSQRKDPIEKILVRYRACPEAIPWASGFATLEEAWQACEAPDWLLWALDAFGYHGERKLRLFAASCALRVQRLWDDPQGTRAIAMATSVASGNAASADLPAAYHATLKASGAIVDRPDYSEAMAAAAAAAVATLRDLGIDAAMDASRESARAVWWDVESPGSWPEEGVWQSNELRRIIGGDVHALFAEVLKKERAVLPLV
jgi:hypothetical protein